MSQTNIMAAFRERWNNAGLNTSVASLHAAAPSVALFGAMPGDLSGATLPRAEFVIERDDPVEHTYNLRVRRATILVRVYAKGSVESYLDTIEAEIDNSDRAATNPMILANSAGKITEVQFVGRETTPIDKNVTLGTLEFQIDWCKVKTIPD